MGGRTDGAEGAADTRLGLRPVAAPGMATDGTEGAAGTGLGLRPATAPGMATVTTGSMGGTAGPCTKAGDPSSDLPRVSGVSNQPPSSLVGNSNPKAPPIVHGNDGSVAPGATALWQATPPTSTASAPSRKGPPAALSMDATDLQASGVADLSYTETGTLQASGVYDLGWSDNASTSIEGTGRATPTSTPTVVVRSGSQFFQIDNTETGTRTTIPVNDSASGSNTSSSFQPRAMILTPCPYDPINGSNVFQPRAASLNSANASINSSRSSMVSPPNRTMKTSFLGDSVEEDYLRSVRHFYLLFKKRTMALFDHIAYYYYYLLFKKRTMALFDHIAYYYYYLLFKKRTMALFLHRYSLLLTTFPIAMGLFQIRCIFPHK